MCSMRRSLLSCCTSMVILTTCGPPKTTSSTFHCLFHVLHRSMNGSVFLQREISLNIQYSCVKMHRRADFVLCEYCCCPPMCNHGDAGIRDLQHVVTPLKSSTSRDQRLPVNFLQVNKQQLLTTTFQTALASCRQRQDFV